MEITSYMSFPFFTHKKMPTYSLLDGGRYDGELKAIVADIRGEKSSNRSLDYEFIVQETVLRAPMLSDT